MEMNLNIVRTDVCVCVNVYSARRTFRMQRTWLTEEPSEQGPQWGTSYLGCEVQMDEYEAVRGARQEAGPGGGTRA